MIGSSIIEVSLVYFGTLLLRISSKVSIYIIQFNISFCLKDLLDVLDDDYKLFITTDTESVAQEAVQKFGKDKVIVAKGLYTHIDREEQSKSCSRVKKTYLDLHFMQHCQKIVISDSNYGKFGTLLRPDWSKDAFIYMKGQFKTIIDDVKFELDSKNKN